MLHKAMKRNLEQRVDFHFVAQAGRVMWRLTTKFTGACLGASKDARGHASALNAMLDREHEQRRNTSSYSEQCETDEYPPKASRIAEVTIPKWIRLHAISEVVISRVNPEGMGSAININQCVLSIEELQSVFAILDQWRSSTVIELPKHKGQKRENKSLSPPSIYGLVRTEEVGSSRQLARWKGSRRTGMPEVAAWHAARNTTLHSREMFHRARAVDSRPCGAQSNGSR